MVPTVSGTRLPGLRRCAWSAEPANGTSNWHNATSDECPFAALALPFAMTPIKAIVLQAKLAGD